MDSRCNKTLTPIITRKCFEPVAESPVLYQSEMLAGSVYLAGRTIENILRAVIRKHDSENRTCEWGLTQVWICRSVASTPDEWDPFRTGDFELQLKKDGFRK